MNVLVMGFYGKQNLGDELFKDAFKTLFPQYTFTFVDHINASSLDGIQYVIFGGGSLLEGKPAITTDALELLKTKTLLYIGVGSETNTHPVHTDLLKQAKLVALRSTEGFEKIRTLCPNKVITSSDLVFALQSSIHSQANTGSLLFLPNVSITPQNHSKYWEHLHWQTFKLEMSQVLDRLVEDGYKIGFLPFCTHPKTSDVAAASELINAMKWRDERYIVSCKSDFASVCETMSKYEVIVSQRYHGLVLSEMLGKPYVAICHHDKLSTASVRNGLYTSYYGLNKKTMLDLIAQAKNVVIPKQKHSFDELIYEVSRIMV